MAEYMTAFEYEIVAESFGDAIVSGAKKIIEVLHKIFDTCIKFLGRLINKLRGVKKDTSNKSQDSSPVFAGRASNEDTEVSEPVTIDNTYDCGNDLYGILADLEFCINLLMKRPKPNHSVGKGYDDRWAQDNTLIEDRMQRCADIIAKLESIENKTIDLEAATKIKAKFESLDKTYTTYGRIYEAFVKKNPGPAKYMTSTQRQFNNISEIATKASKINLSLMTPKGD